MGVIAFQAGAARRVIETRPGEAAQALGEIESAGRDVLAGLRRMLVALRDGDAAPAAGLADLARLGATGVSVEIRELGGRRALPPEVDAAAYRIIQEALTNVARHAATGSCVVTIDYRDADLAVEIVDAGRGVRGSSCRGSSWPACGSGRFCSTASSRGPRAGRRFPGRGPAAGGGAMTVRVLLADDQPLIRTALRLVIADAPAWRSPVRRARARRRVRLARRSSRPTWS